MHKVWCGGYAGSNWQRYRAEMVEEMTNKPMLSVELRELLERLMAHEFAEDCQECGIGQSDAWHELRALLDNPQCEECKGWGYHENHYEGGGTECGECGGSGNATVAVVMPDRMKVEPFTTIDRGSKNYKAGYNAAIAEVARLNGVKT